MNAIRFNVKLAGHKFTVTTNFFKARMLCSDYLCDVDVGDTSYRIEILPDDIRKFDVYTSDGNFQEPVGASGVASSKAYSEFCLLHERIANYGPYLDFFLMHGSALAYEGNAYIFTAPSGVGKTTRTRIWLEEFPGSYVINGDKPLIKVTDDLVYACGSPWCGKEKMNRNVMVPLQAIFLLERADEEAKIVVKKVSFPCALPHLLSQVYMSRDKEGVKRTLGLMKSMGPKVNIYHLAIPPTRDAIRMICKVAVPPTDGNSVKDGHAKSI